MTSPLVLESHRAALTGHCYRMLGSVVDADDAVQDTMLRALRALDRFDGRSSLGTWLYRIATNVCLDFLSSRERRMRPMEMGPVGTTEDTLTTLPSTHWLEPVPDALAIPSDHDPHERAVLRESVRLAFVSALQHLPPRQRAVLILTQVLNWSAAEVAECLEMTTAAVNSALQRARATLAEKQLTRAVERTSQYVPVELTPEQRRLLDRYVEAFEAYDVSALTMLLREDAVMSMPPFSLWLQGHESIAKWLSGPGRECRGSRLVPTAANGSPAFGQYRDGGATPWALVVLELEGDRIAALNSFLDTDTLFPRFGLPPRLTDATAG
ncbi:MAG: sigma-70 family RNA polymerase sigma factor [Gemmatimonadaceae bacterium]|nr:sigma-70 family RNA polymerase sigma factor [Gemmatimonadaceae bacterium]MCC6431112.1 sigma-70 family RNA polymerase sigma factor [Gemmatimonadaceae bacterium]